MFIALRTLLSRLGLAGRLPAFRLAGLLHFNPLTPRPTNAVVVGQRERSGRLFRQRRGRWRRRTRRQVSILFVVSEGTTGGRDGL